MLYRWSYERTYRFNCATSAINKKPRLCEEVGGELFSLYLYRGLKVFIEFTSLASASIQLLYPVEELGTSPLGEKAIVIIDRRIRTSAFRQSFG